MTDRDEVKLMLKHGQWNVCADRSAGGTGRVVDTENKGRGYELSKGRYVPIDPDELDAVNHESTHTIEIDDFVPEEEVDQRYLDRPYYVVPDGKAGADAFAVIRDP